MKSMIWLQKIKRCYIHNRLKGHKIPLPIWQSLESEMPLLARYDRHQKVQLRLLASRLLQKKRITAVQGFEVTAKMRAMIATQAAIMVFKLMNAEEDLSFDWYRNWHEILVYPDSFRPYRNPITPLQGGILGVEIDFHPVESGETSYQGPVIISWRNDQPHPLKRHANQVLIHELAHKLDMLTGEINGRPPLHKHMDSQDWFKAFESAYKHLNHQIAKGHKPAINPYAATNPAEFFAVCSEYFFEAPAHLNQFYPAVYRQLSLFYNQNFLQR